GIITALYSVGGMIGGALFAPANKALGRMIVPLAWVVLVLAMACGAFGNSLFFLGACTLLCGVAIYIAMPAVLGMVAVIVPPKGQALASSIFWAALNALGFLAAVWMNFLIGLNGDVRFPIYVGMIAIAVVAVVWFLVSLRKPKAER
ncbi:MAG: hypothetical protein IJJ14_04015, partial [Coriobacteriales bacterium]|nr:hypothetical protein [Coriobacteriales bacterium]